jgi:hypothetical protein
MNRQGKFILFDTVHEFSQWLEQQSISRVIKLIQNHHTYNPNYRSFNGSNHFQELVSMEAAHLERGFAEVAQNLTTFPDGKIALCRNLNTVPAGIKGANSNGICIEHVACFDRWRYDDEGVKYPGDVINPTHTETIIGLNAALCKHFKLVPNTNSIVYHAWFNLTTGIRDNNDGKLTSDKDHKTCPGSAFFGGNTVKAAATNFVPLVAQRMG